VVAVGVAQRRRQAVAQAEVGAVRVVFFQEQQQPYKILR
jgi:hypothetical protein